MNVFVRLLKSFVLFILIISLLGFYFLKNKDFLKEQLFAVKDIYSTKKNVLSQDHEPLFYHSIGQGPLEPKTSYEIQPESNSLFSVEVGHYSKQQDAEKIIRDLNKQGLVAYYTPFRKGTDLLYRVRVGFYSDKKKADYVLKQIQLHHKESALINL